MTRAGSKGAGRDRVAESLVVAAAAPQGQLGCWEASQDRPSGSCPPTQERDHGRLSPIQLLVAGTSQLWPQPSPALSPVPCPLKVWRLVRASGPPPVASAVSPASPPDPGHAR